MKKLKFTTEDVATIIKQYSSYRSLLLALNVAAKGANYERLKTLIKENNLDNSHFLGYGWRRGKEFKLEKIKPEKILVKNSTYSSGVHRAAHQIKNLILKLELKKEICERCLLIEWQGNKIPLELHHIDGDNKNNEIENLQILCPNCHALTDNYRGKNIKAM